jgi:hypothetical protein
MSLFSALVLLALYSPYHPTTPRPEVRRLGAHILMVYPRCPYAGELADAIWVEALSRGIDPALLAAIAWTESGYRRGVRGSSGEIGLWQLLPGPWLAGPWSEVRGHRPPWRRLSKAARRRLCADILVGTYLAGWIVEHHLQICGEHSANCYAAYNSGSVRYVRPSYVRRIRRRAEVIREVLMGRPR